MRQPTLPALALCLLLTAFAPTAATAATAATPAGGATTPEGHAAPHPFDVHDLLAMRRISDPQVAPDGSAVAFVVRDTDLEANKGRTDLWLVPLATSSGADGGEAAGAPRRLTTDPAADTDPRFSPDGRWIYFVSARSGSPQIWRLPTAGGEAERLTDLPLEVANPVVSPDGSRIAFTMEVFVDCDTPQCTADRLAAEEKDPATGRLYDRLFVRHWDTWKDGRRSHLFTLELGGEGGAAPVDVTRGLDADVPSKPFGGVEEIAFSPDGARLAFTARDAGREEAWSTDFDVYLVPADGSAAPRNLTQANQAWDTQPVFSPDGRTLAYLAMARPGYESDRFRIALLDLGAGEGAAPRVLTEGWDRSPGSLLFSADGGTLYATAADLGQTALFAVAVADGEVERLVGEGTVRSPQLVPAAGGSGAAGGRLVFGRDTLTSPVELYSVAADGSDLRRLTDLNRETLDRAVLGEPEQFSFAGWNGETVYGWVVKPAGFEPGRRYPIAFLIHGGPQGSFGNDFHYRWNPQTYAGAGFAAVTVDFHGSVGYGQAFTDSIRDDWGGKPLEDLQKGLAAAVERYGWLDGDRACALGASYGGYMINWIAGNWPDRFRCLVNHDGLFDHRMMYYTTEELWFPEWEHMGPYYAAAEAHERHNPANHVEAWKTPMLVVHGAHDYRVPETQALATFTALQRRGVASELLWFPDENHWVLKPANGVLWHDTVGGWLDRWLRDGG